MKTIGIIGAGQMGSGIAHVCALADLDVLLHDVNEEAIESGLATISGNLARQVSSEKITDADRHAALARLKPATDPHALGIADMVIEAATENEDIKRSIYKSICPVLAPDAILATNTSSISAKYLPRPFCFLGLSAVK